MAARESSAPRIRVAALILRDGFVVLVRHRLGQRTYHLLPGGGVDWGESLERALEREVSEETGLTCKVGRPVILTDTIAPDDSRHVLNVTFACEVAGGALTAAPADPRVEAVDLVDPAELSTIDLRPPIAEEILALIRNPDEPAVYTGVLYRPD